MFYARFPKRSLTIAALIASTVLAGCYRNSLDVVPLHLEETSAEPVAGVPYYLPMTRIGLNVTLTIRKCEAEVKSQAELALERAAAKPGEIVLPVRLNLDAAMRDSSTLNRQVDTSTAYVIDFLSLEDPFSTSSIEVRTHPDGTLASLNGQSESRITDIVGELAMVAKNVALLVAGGGAPLSAAGVTRFSNDRKISPSAADPRQLRAVSRSIAVQLCKALNDNIKERNRLNREVKKETAKIRQIEARLYRATNAELKRLNTLTERRVNLQEQLDQFIKKTTVVVRRDWLPEGYNTENQVNSKASVKLVPSVRSIVALDIGKGVTGRDDLVAAALASARKSLTITASLKLPSGAPVIRGSGHAELRRPHGDHLVVRAPARLTLQVISLAEDNGVKDIPVRKQVVPIAHLGQAFTLPFQNDAFDDNTLMAEFDELGLIRRVKYESEAQALEFARTLNAATGGGVATRDAIRSERAASAAARNAEIRSQIEFLQLQQQLRALQVEAPAE